MKKDKLIGQFQGLDVYTDCCGEGTYIETRGLKRIWLGVETNAAEEITELKAALAKANLRTRAEVDAEIVRVLRASVAKGTRDDCLALHDDEYEYPDAGLLRQLCAEETQDP